MSEISEKVKAEIAELIEKAARIRDAADRSAPKSAEQETSSEQIVPAIAYQEWYTKSLTVVRQLLPDRYQEFVEHYRDEKRNKIDFITYAISDYLLDLRILNVYDQESFDHHAVFVNRFQAQTAILRSCLSRLDSILANIHGTLQASLFDDELSAAEELFKKDHVRAAGALAGVTLERHLATVADSHNVKVSKKTPTIADFNDALKTAEVYDVPNWRLIQRLGDIRNLAVHNKDREPTKDEIDDLISGTQKIIKTIF